MIPIIILATPTRSPAMRNSPFSRYVPLSQPGDLIEWSPDAYHSYEDVAD